ncbi:hypothetical protein P280DRAFT_465655 [Massarina eburnea CBS 473.64]|uniref:Uncharacterized protein n=1 Tax=Massarina eburnea CBS 473.64 TaxID=1395130 RepID=A0A6A6SHL9_9PLEO|nr:hypothetical protein P280DRAFT_465655 [Massarina eburnea CBS 473.64]
MASVPTNEQILNAVRIIQTSTPDLGRAKVLAQLKTENNWTLSDNRFRKLLDTNDVKRKAEPPKDRSSLVTQSQSLGPIDILKNALMLQERYKEESIRCFQLYGRGEYDYGVTLNAEMAIYISIFHNRLKAWGAPGPWSQKDQARLATGQELQTIYNFYWVAAQKVGLAKEDIGRQLEAEYAFFNFVHK